MLKQIIYFVIYFILILIGTSCYDNKTDEIPTEIIDSLKTEIVEVINDTILPGDIHIKKQLLYDQYTLEDTYPYQDTTRMFQWEKIRERLALLEYVQRIPATWAVLQNYKNLNGESPLVNIWHRNAYKRVSDTLGVERWQSIALYPLNDTIMPVLYARDGSLVKHLSHDSLSSFAKIEMAETAKQWMVKKKYIRVLNDSIVFNKAIFVDVTNQNITTMEKQDSVWLVRSMNPATTGRHKPPYAQETPTGLFVIQEKKSKMVFLKDGSNETGGFAPYASRFTNGAYLHGIPSNAPQKNIIEYSWSLGTVPKSHMCVRNASSHAKFIYDWAPSFRSVVFVID